MMRRPLLYIFILTIFAVSVASMAEETAPKSDPLRDLIMRADSGDADALYRLATLYDTGFDTIPVDTLMSTRLYERAAEAGSLPAQNYLGYRLYRGDGVARDIPRALEWLESAALSGDPRAAGNLGYLLLEGEGVEHDEENAAFWLGRAALQEVATAQSMLGDLYRDGRGVEQDSIMAESLYRRSLENGLADAGYKLESLNANRRKSMDAGERLEEAVYFYTHGVPAIGVSLLEDIAAMRKNTHEKETAAAALALLGDAYTRGLGVAYDHQKALDFYALAAMEGNPSAMFILGELLEIFPDAMSTLSGEALQQALSYPQDAVWWIEEAAKKGIRDAETANRRLFFFK